MSSRKYALPFIAGFLFALLVLAQNQQSPDKLVAGASAFGDFRQEQPGVTRRITVADLPAPFATPSAKNHPKLVERPEGVLPKCLPGFRVSLYQDGLEAPRYIRTAPNGDLFVAESTAENGVNKVL